MLPDPFKICSTFEIDKINSGCLKITESSVNVPTGSVTGWTLFVTFNVLLPSCCFSRRSLNNFALFLTCQSLRKDS